MRVRYKTSLVIGIVFLLLALLSGLYISSRLHNGYGALEWKAQRRDGQLVRQSLLSELSAMRVAGIGWAHWDDLVAYMNTGDKKFEELNFSWKALRDLPSDITVVLDSKKEVVWNGVVHEVDEATAPVPPELLTLLRKVMLESHVTTEEALPSGFLRYQGNLLAFSALHILMTQRQGDPAGYFVMAKVIELPDVLQGLGLQHARVELIDGNHVRGTEDGISVGRSSAGTVYATLLAPSVFYGPSVALQMSSQDQMAAEGHNLRALIYRSYLLMAGLLVLATYVILERLIFRRLETLSTDLQSVEGEKPSDVIIRDQGDDELGFVGRKAAELLRSLNDRYDEVQRVGFAFRETADNTPVNIWKVSGEGVITYNNATFQTTTGVDFTGCHFSELLNFVHPEDRGKARDALVTVKQEGRVSLEVRILRKGGDFEWSLVSLARLEGEEGTNGFVGSATNVQHEKEAQRQLAEAHKLAVELSQAKSNFIATVSHELRTPMNGILGTTAILLDTPLSDVQREELHTIQSCGNHLLIIINDLLDFSRITAGRLELSIAPFSLNSLLTQLESLFKPQLLEKEIQLFIDVGSSTPDLLEGDLVRIQQILTNLIGNSVKFVRKGGSIIVLVGSRPREDGRLDLEISVSDTGIGMSIVDQRKIFEPFTQADSSITRQFGGTGLGLAITRKLVELHGGDISVRSILHRGTAFTFTIRVERAKRLLVQEEQSVELPAGLQILLVEDNLINQKVAAKLLSSMGYRVTVAGDGEEAISKILDHPFDLVLMDCQMPKLDGISATRAIRRMEKEVESPLSTRPRIPIVAMTARAMEEDRLECLACGMDGFVAKPIKVAELKKVLLDVTEST